MNQVTEESPKHQITRKFQIPSTKSQTHRASGEINLKSKAPRLKTPAPRGGAVWNFGFSSVLNLFGIWCLEFGASALGGVL
ncbi:MAG: hypothetical protein FJ280_12740 [Planctomycetes bacterium]|nr:hypothetical protein [Planctomycetota bacterium]